jgi:hypothetical protein
MRNLFWSALLLTVMISSGCTISGRITHQATDLEGITVNLSGRVSRSTNTNNEGGYKFARLRSGNYTVTPTSDRYYFMPESRSATVAISPNAGVTAVDFEAYEKDSAPAKDKTRP